MSGPRLRDNLVDGEWLAGRLEDPRVRVIQVDLSPEPYLDGHIPGAVFWDFLGDLVLPDFRINFDRDVLGRLLGRSGIDGEMTCVCVGGADPQSRSLGGWLFWLLKELGHPSVRVLDGGIRKWALEGRPMTAEEADTPEVEYSWAGGVGRSRVSSEELDRTRGEESSVILDVRTPAEYTGELYLMAPPKADERAGHIPGAVHIPHELDFAEDGTLRPAGELRELYESHGVTPDKHVVAYCAAGARSGHTCFVLSEVLGYPRVANYVGGWNEWSRNPDCPVERS